MNFLLLMITILDMLVSAATCLTKLLVLVLIQIVVHKCQIIQYAKDVKVVISLVLRKPGRQ